MKIRLNLRLPVAPLVAGFAGVVVAVALASAGDAATASAAYESTVPTGPIRVCGSRPTLLVDGATFTAGEPAEIEGCNWYANLGCSESVHVTLKAETVDYTVGQLSPHTPHIHVEGSYGWPDGLTITGGVSFRVGADGKITIPESANLTTNAIRATMSGTQKLQTRHFESTDPSRPFIADDRQVYNARLSFAFRIARARRITGSGRGRYVSASWHGEGTFGSSPFSCDAPMKTPPFAIHVTGHASGGRIALRLRLKAMETNEKDVFCQPNFKLESSTTTRLADSFTAVGADSPAFAIQNPKAQLLPKHEDLIQDSIPTNPPTRAHVVRDSQWKIAIRRRGGGRR